jgi:hypothetical protein
MKDLGSLLIPQLGCVSTMLREAGDICFEPASIRCHLEGLAIDFACSSFDYQTIQTHINSKSNQAIKWQRCQVLQCRPG